MKKVIVLGDVHANIRRCKQVCDENPNASVVQLGDLGVGFVHPHEIKSLPDNFRFFVGNHDNRTKAAGYPNCLGHFGEYENFFFVSGANSIDRHVRTPFINWWPDEELDKTQCDTALAAWQNSNKQIIVSHDAPQCVVEQYFLIYDTSNTRKLLDAMIKIRRPKLVVFGHHHRPIANTCNGFEFRGLKIDETFELPNL